MWDFECDGVTQSFLKLFQLCKEQTRLRYCEGWTSRKKSFAIEFGEGFQLCLCDLYSLVDLPAHVDILTSVEVYSSAWTKETPRPTQAALVQHTLVCGMLSVVLEQYCAVYDGDWTGKYTQLKSSVAKPSEWLGLESRFKVFVAPGLCVNSTYLQGSFDGIFEDKAGNVFLLETKTKGQINEQQIQDLLPFDFQVLFYLTALSIELGRHPKGVVYNVVRRPGLRQKKDEPMEAFLDRIIKDIETPERCAHYFHRWECRISKRELEKWQKEVLWPLMADAETWANDNTYQHYPNYEALVTKYGKADLYDLIVHGDTSALYKRKVVFNELEER